MAVDIRASTYCSLGTVISGSFSDSYAQGSGLIFTRGQVELKGTVRPDVGTKVSFAYQRKGYLARIPRSLRVLSSFADPFRRTTTVQLGCQLTFLESRKPPVEDPKSKDENQVECKVYDKATLPISAKYVAEQIMDAVGIAYDTVPLTNYFSVEEFDLTPGFIQVLGDLLVSEGYLGYLDEQEILRFCDLGDEVGAGPVIANSDVVDIGPIGVGELPGDSVIVRYSSLRLKPPDELEDEQTRAKRNWEWDESFGTPQAVTVSYQDDNGDEVTLNGTYNPYDFSATFYDVWDRAVERFEYNTSSIAEVNRRYVIDRHKKDGVNISYIPTSRFRTTTWKYKVPAPLNSEPIGMPYIQSADGIEGIKNELSSLVVAQTEPADDCIYERPDDYDKVLEEISESYISELEVAGTLNLDSFTFEESGGSTLVSLTTAAFPPGAFGIYTAPESRTIVTYDKDDASGITKTKTAQYMMYGKTTSGQQDLATKVEDQPSITTAVGFENWVKARIADSWALRYVGLDVRIRTEREYGLQRRPDQKDRNNTANQKPDVTEQEAELIWITGSTESTNYVEFTMPYAPDDRIQWSALNGYTSTPSDAGTKALRYGRIQNRLLLGNRSGVSLQLPIELLPARPFDPLYLEAEGLTGQYRVNASTFTFDANGIVASADCLFWGGVGEEP